MGLRGEDYERMAQSRLLRFVEVGLRKQRPEWVREIRRWARSRGDEPDTKPETL